MNPQKLAAADGATCPTPSTGVALLSGILRSPGPAPANIAIMRAFVRLRQMLSNHQDSARKLHQMEKKYNARFKVVFDAIRELMAPPLPPRKRQIRAVSAIKGTAPPVTTNSSALAGLRQWPMNTVKLL